MLLNQNFIDLGPRVGKRWSKNNLNIIPESFEFDSRRSSFRGERNISVNLSTFNYSSHQIMLKNEASLVII